MALQRARSLPTHSSWLRVSSVASRKLAKSVKSSLFAGLVGSCFVLAACDESKTARPSAQELAPTSSAFIPRSTPSASPTALTPFAIEHFPNPERRWNRSPTILVIARAEDSRIPLLFDAVRHWNGQLEQIGTPFRLGDVTVQSGSLPPGTMSTLSSATVAGELPVTPAARRDAYLQVVTGKTGDLVVVLSEEVFVSFAAPFLPSHYIVGIRNHMIPPLTLPNVARNVILHEIGHAIGLGHNNDPTKLMCGRPADCRPDAFQSSIDRYFPLTDEEKALLLRLYPHQ